MLRLFLKYLNCSTLSKELLHWTTNFKKFFVSVINMLLIYLFASMKLENRHKKSFGSSFKIMLPL